MADTSGACYRMTEYFCSKFVLSSACPLCFSASVMLLSAWSFSKAWPESLWFCHSQVLFMYFLADLGWGLSRFHLGPDSGWLEALFGNCEWFSLGKDVLTGSDPDNVAGWYLAFHRSKQLGCKGRLLKDSVSTNQEIYNTFLSGFPI